MSKQINIAINTPVKVAKLGSGTVQAVKAGWFTIELDNGDVIKTRAKNLALAGAVKDGYVKAGICTYDPSRYTLHDVKTVSGRKAYDTGDKTADRLRGKTLEEAYAIAAKILAESTKGLVERYGHLNPGQQRMCLGNRMRNA